MTTAFANDRDVGNLASGEHLTSNIDFYTLNTVVALDEGEFASSNAAKNLIRLGEIIGIQAQPVMTGLHVFLAADPADYGMTASSPATVYVLKFSIEHTNAWINTDVSGTVPGTLAYALVNETALCALATGDSLVMGTNASLTFSAIL